MTNKAPKSNRPAARQPTESSRARNRPSKRRRGSNVKQRGLFLGVGAAIVGLIVAMIFLAGGGTSPDTFAEFELQRDAELADGTVHEAGSTVSLTDFQDGRPMVLNFFASWCPPCIAEMPDIQNVFADAGEEVNFLGVTNGDTVDRAQDIVDQTGVQYPWGFDDTGNFGVPSSAIFLGFNGAAMPTTVFLDADGQEVARQSGFMTESQLRGFIADNFGVDT